MVINTTRFGDIKIDENTIIDFPSGILGFPKYAKYVLLDMDENSPLKWMQSTEEPSLAFVVTNPNLFMPDYSIDATRKDLSDIQVENAEDVIILVLVTIPKDPSLVTANLKGPVLVNTKNNKGKQLIIDNPEYSIKFSLITNDAFEEVI